MMKKDYENSQPSARLYFTDVNRKEYVTPYLTPINYCPLVIAMMKEKK